MTPDRVERAQMQAAASQAARLLERDHEQSKPQPFAVNVVFILIFTGLGIMTTYGLVMAYDTGQRFYISFAVGGFIGIIAGIWRIMAYDNRTTRKEYERYAEPQPVMSKPDTRFEIHKGTHTQYSGPFTRRQRDGLRNLARNGESLATRNLERYAICTRNQPTIYKHIYKELVRLEYAVADGTSYKLTPLGVARLSEAN